jgi:hypothetical protein
MSAERAAQPSSVNSRCGFCLQVIAEDAENLHWTVAETAFAGNALTSAALDTRSTGS